MSESKILKAVGTTVKGRTIATIAYKAGLSYGYTAFLIGKLVAAGEVKVVGKEKVSGVGRPAKLYTIL